MADDDERSVHSGTGRETEAEGDPDATKSKLSTTLRKTITRQINTAVAYCNTTRTLRESVLRNQNAEELTVAERLNQHESYRAHASILIQPIDRCIQVINEKVDEWTQLITDLPNEQDQRNERAFRRRYFGQVLDAYLEKRGLDEDEQEECQLTVLLVDCDDAIQALRAIIDNKSDYDSVPSSALQSVNGDRSYVRTTTPPPQEREGHQGAAGTKPALTEQRDIPPLSVATAHPTLPASSLQQSLISPTTARRERESHRDALASMNGNVNDTVQTSKAARDKGQEHPLPHLAPPPPALPPLQAQTSYSHPLNGQSGQMSTGVMAFETKSEEERRKVEERRMMEEGKDSLRDQREYEARVPTSIHYRSDAMANGRNYQQPLPGTAYPVGSSVTPMFLPTMPSLSLPAMPLPKFDGKEPWAYSTFLNTFESMVISQPGLNDFARLFYLKSCLQGEALDAVGAIVAGEGCYSAAKERLDSIYEKGSQLMAAKLRQRIQQIRKPPDGSGCKEELKGIRELLNLVSQLFALQREADNPFLTDAIVSKLPEKALKKAVKLRTKNPEIGTIALLNEVEEAVISDYNIQLITHSSNKSLGQVSRKENVRNTIEYEEGTDSENDESFRPPVLAMLPNRSVFPQTAEKASQAKCAFCGKHAAGQEERCRMYSTPEERAARCRQLRLCFRCIVGGASHNFRRCEVKCRHCDGAHHASLCKKLSNRKTIDKQTEEVHACMGEEDGVSDGEMDRYYDQMERERDGEAVLTMSEIVGTTTTQAIPRIPRIRSAKLLTFQAQLMHPCTGKIHSINVMIDPGASVGLISERTVQILQLKCIGAAETGFSGVGGNETEFGEYKVHRIKIRSPVTNFVMEVDTYEFPHPLTGPERQFEFDKADWSFMKKAKLDTAILDDADGIPDVLVSLDEFMEVANTGQKSIRLPSGMRLYPTAFGYIRAGSTKAHAKEAVQCFIPDRVNMVREGSPHSKITDNTVDWDRAKAGSLGDSTRVGGLSKGLYSILCPDQNLEDIEKGMRSILRVHKEDEAIVQMIEIPKGREVTTKQEYLQVISNLSDPNGLISPITIPLKRIMQRIDGGNPKFTDIPLLKGKIARDIKVEMSKLTGSVTIPRVEISESQRRMNGDLVICCHSDDEAYAAAVYWIEEGKTNAQLILAQNRLFKQVVFGTRDEFGQSQRDLRAIALGSKLAFRAITILNSLGLKVERTLGLTDSPLASNRVNARRSETIEGLNIFASKRVNEIIQFEEEITKLGCSGIEFRYISEESNPAVLATQGMTVSELSNPWEPRGRRWWKGTESPSGMKAILDNLSIPNPPDFDSRSGRQAFLGSCHPMYRKMRPDYVVAMRDWIPLIDEKDPLYIPPSTIRETDSYAEVVIMLVQKMRSENQKEPSSTTLLPTDRTCILAKGPIGEQERKHAENLLFRQHQHRFREKWDHLYDHRPMKAHSFVMGRGVNRGWWSYTDPHPPILLFPKDPLTHKLIIREHLIGEHSNAAATHKRLRQAYWIVNGLQTVKKALQRCRTCTECRFEKTTEQEKAEQTLSSLSKNEENEETDANPPSRTSPVTSLIGSTFSSMTLICCLMTLLIPCGSSLIHEETIKCLPHGLRVNATPGYGIEICTSTNCQIFTPASNNGSVTAVFPPSMSAGEFDVSVKLVTENATFFSQRTCPASDVCKSMKNDWSSDHLIVPHCYPGATLAIIGVIAYTITTILSLVGYMTCYRQVTGAEIVYSLWECHCCGLRGIARIARFLVSLLTAPCRWLRRPGTARGDGRRRERRDQIRRSTRAILGMTLISLPLLATGCNHAITTIEEVERCNDGVCSVERGMEVQMDALSRSGCIQFRNGTTGEIQGVISIEVLANELKCVKGTQGLHRDAESHVASSKRCYGAGSCDGKQCESIRTEDEIPEFDHLSQFPGHTHCTESGGGWENGCLSFHTGCLFYKTYLIPTSQKVYESMICTTWINRVTLRINVTIGGKSSSSKVTLREGEFTHDLREQGISLIRMEEIETPEHYNFLLKGFLTDGTRMAITRDLRVNNICVNEEAASDFQCRALEKCTCQPATVKAKCECDSSSLEQQFTLANTLPIRLPSMEVVMDEDKLAPRILQHRGNVKIYVVLSEEIDKARVQEEMIGCSVKAEPLTGCYNCEGGAKAMFECSASRETDALISCEGNAFSIPCNPSGVQSERKLYFGQSLIDTRCQSSCDKREILLSGVLFTPPNLAPSHTMQRIKGGEVPRGDFLPDLTPVGNFIRQYWIASMIVGVVTIGIAIATTAMLTIGPTAIFVSLSRCYRSRPNKGRYKNL